MPVTLTFNLLLYNTVIFQRQIQKNLLDTIASKKASRGKSTSFTDEELKDCFTLKEQCKCDTKNKVGSNWEAYGKIVYILRKVGCIRKVTHTKSRLLSHNYFQMGSIHSWNNMLQISLC
jgi:hypothetical protein